MFIHNFKYTLKSLFKNKTLIFWTFAFPIILGTFFNMAFSNIEKSEKLDIIDIAIIENKEFDENEVFRQAFKTLSDKENSNRLFNIKYVDLKKAKKMLEKGEITGYLLLQDTPKIIVTKSGIEETIFKYITEEIFEQQKIIENIISNKNIDDYDDYFKSLYDKASLVSISNNIKDISSNNLSYTMIEFYTLIAMACLYSGILGMVCVNRNLANMSSNGKRMQVSPVSKSKLIFSSVLSSYVVALIGLILLLVYTIFVLKVDYGNNLPLVIILILVGCFAGLQLGVVVASLFKTNDNTKTGIITSITMLGCFLSGMMGITMKYIIDKNLPLVNKLNPANMITDGFYSLYYYDTLDRFYFNVISLLIFAFILLLISIFSLRRQKYDSI